MGILHKPALYPEWKQSHIIDASIRWAGFRLIAHVRKAQDRKFSQIVNAIGGGRGKDLEVTSKLVHGATSLVDFLFPISDPRRPI
jgi:hypothetical protein